MLSILERASKRTSKQKVIKQLIKFQNYYPNNKKIQKLAPKYIRYTAFGNTGATEADLDEFIRLGLDDLPPVTMEVDQEQRNPVTGLPLWLENLMQEEGDLANFDAAEAFIDAQEGQQETLAEIIQRNQRINADILRDAVLRHGPTARQQRGFDKFREKIRERANRLRMSASDYTPVTRDLDFGTKRNKI
tara:strand:- start:1911 stop:2480 length:570 start_codon:yes stop_codon:yes gene_type:complete